MQFVFDKDRWVAVSNNTIGTFEAEDQEEIVQFYDSTTYNLHTRSEHSINGEKADMELQLVFDLNPSKSPAQTEHSKAVISVLFNIITEDAQKNELMKAVDILYLEEDDDGGYKLNVKMQ